MSTPSVNALALVMKIIVIFCVIKVFVTVRTEILTRDQALASIHENVYIYNEAKRALNQTLYMVVASNMVRPGQVYRVIVTVPSAIQPVTVRAYLQRNGEQISSASEMATADHAVTLLMQVPFNAIKGSYRLKVEGGTNGQGGGKLFEGERDVQFSERFLTILIETNQLVYNLEQTMHIRAILLTTELKPFADPVDVFLVDSRDFVMKRWVSVYPYLGFVTLKFEIPYDYQTGWWTIRVIALGQVEENRVLMERWFSHRFDVNVATPTFILKTEDTLSGSVLANYTNVATVTGNLTLRTHLRPLDKLRYAAIDWGERYLEDRVSVFQGTYDFEIKMHQLRELASPVPLENCEIEVQADVGERFYDFVVHAYARVRVLDVKVNIRFLGTTPQVFKPGMPFRTHVAVSYDDFVPLEEHRLTTSSLYISAFAFIGGRRVQLPDQRISDFQDGITAIEIQPPDRAERLYIQAHYEDSDDVSARAELNVISFHSRSGRHIQITSSTKLAEAGEYGIFHVRSNFYLPSFNYVVISKGIILQSGLQEVTGMIQTITTFSIPVSTEMAPVFQIIVYHVAPDAEVFADSISLPVHAINKRRFVLDINMRQERSGNYIELVPRLTSETIVGVSGYDSDHVSTHGRQQLTPTSVLEAMYSFEKDYLHFQRVLWRDRDGGADKIHYFITQNYGRDGKQTFELADIITFTNFNINSVADHCNITNGLKQCVSGECYPVNKECDGIKDCEDGTDEGRCFSAEFEQQRDLLNFFLYRRNRQNAFYDATASNFAWSNKIIGEDQEEYIGTTAPKGPSAYALSAIAISKNFGLHILEAPIIFDSTKPFLVIVEGPTSAAVGEQVGLLVVVINYQFIEIKAEIVLPASDDYRFVQVEPFGIVSSYRPRTTGRELQHLIYVKPVSHVFVHVPVVATRIGDIDITIIGRTQVAKDVATHTINVVPDGVPTHLHTSMLLDMRNEAYLIRYLDVNVTEDPIIPFEETYRRYIFGSAKATVSVIGDVVGAPVPNDMSPYIGLSALSSADAVKSGDHIMFDFAYVLYTTHYLRLTNQLTNDLQKQLLGYLNKAYVYETVFYKNGGYSMFKGEQASVWLTAYCTRVFHLAQYSDWENDLYIDQNLLLNSMHFIMQHQTSDGSFYEDIERPWNRRMNPKFPGIYDGNQYRNISLTAHVLLTLTAVADMSGNLKVDLSNAKNLAVKYLERMLPQLKNPYQVAIVTYALMESGSVEGKTGFNMLDAMKREKEGLVYWSPEPVNSYEILYQNQRPFILPRLVGKYDSLAVEATAYALLVYINFGGVAQDQIVKWLNTMRTTDRAFISSQDTIVAIQALTEYSFRSHIRDITSMRVSVESSSNPGDIHQLYVSNDNLAEYRRISVAPFVWGHVEAIAQGSGLSILQLDVEYNVDKDFLLIQPPVPSFDLRVKGYYHGRNKSHINMNSCARWTLTSESETSGLAVIEIALPTGYFLHKPDLDKYVHSKVVPRLQRGRVYPKSAVFMFDYLDSAWSCVNFTIQRWYPVANLTRFLKAKVYDYYTPERYKEIIYEEYDLYVLNICEVCGSYQCPYCPYFSSSTRHLLSLVLFFLPLLTLSFHRLL